MKGEEHLPGMLWLPYATTRQQRTGLLRWLQAPSDSGLLLQAVSMEELFEYSIRTELILKRLQRQNKDLVTQGWRVCKRTEKGKKGVRLVLTIDYTPSLEVLKRLDWKPTFGMGLAELTLFSSRTRTRLPRALLRWSRCEGKQNDEKVIMSLSPTVYKAIPTELDLHGEGVTTVQRMTGEVVSDINLIHATLVS